MIDKRTHDDPLSFINECMNNRRIFWTYHVNMRMKNRFISREIIELATGSFEIIESYPEDKYLPSYLVYANYDDVIFHIVFAVDYAGKNVRIVTAYYPDPMQWDSDLKRRKKL